jgi:formate dehydrogenase major subunit
MTDSVCVPYGHCATVHPTGSITTKGFVDSAMLQYPRFSQKNPIGKVIEYELAETATTPHPATIWLRRYKTT